MSLNNTGSSLANVENVVVGGLPVSLGDAVEVGDGITQRLGEFALASGAHERILDRLVIPEQVDLKREVIKSEQRRGMAPGAKLKSIMC